MTRAVQEHDKLALSALKMSQCKPGIDEMRERFIRDMSAGHETDRDDMLIWGAVPSNEAYIH